MPTRTASGVGSARHSKLFLRVFAVATWQDYPAESGLACSDPTQSQCGGPAWFAGKPKLVSQCPSWQHQLPAFESTPSHHNTAPGQPSPWMFTYVIVKHQDRETSPGLPK